MKPDVIISVHRTGKYELFQRSAYNPKFPSKYIGYTVHFMKFKSFDVVLGNAMQFLMYAQHNKNKSQTSIKQPPSILNSEDA